MNFNEPPHPAYYGVSSTQQLQALPLEAPQGTESKTLDMIIVCGGALFLFFYTDWLLTSLVERTFSPLLLCLPYVGAFLWEWCKRKQKQRRSAFIDRYEFPGMIGEKIGKRYPHLSKADVQLVMQGLRQYFQLCNNSEGMAVAMPSSVVDAAWHEFILMTRSYEQFCIKAFDRFLHHTPGSGEQTANVISNGMMNAWRRACEWEQINLAQPARLPFLFMVDSALQIPDGLMHNLENYRGIDFDIKEKSQAHHRVCDYECVGTYNICEACQAQDDK